MKGALDLFDLTGRTALITGAGGLLGVEHAAALLELGASVVLTDLRADGLAAAEVELSALAEPGQLMSMRMDVTSESDIQGVARELDGAGRRIDVLINNAAVDPKVSASKSDDLSSSRLETLDRSRWDFELAVGLTGPFLCSRVFGGAMAADGRGGVILNIASDLSVIAPDQRLYRRDGLAEDEQPVKPVTYSVIKTGLVGLTRYLATYWPNGLVRCNALSPGGVEAGQGEDFVRAVSSLIPMGRMAQRSSYRGAVQFLCSDASAYLTGQNLVMDGGRSVW